MPMKTLLLLLAGLLPPTTALAAMDRATSVSLGASVLRIEASRSATPGGDGGGGGFALGSGVAVGGDKVVTNCHVTRAAREVHVVHGGARWRVAAQAIDVERDLCLLHVPGIPARSVRFGRAADLTQGQSVTALGYTGGVGMHHSAGEVIALHRHDGASVIQTSNRFSSGASGGGLFDDEGQFVGILTFRLRGGEAHYFAAPAEWVRQMLDNPAPAAYRKIAPIETPLLAYWQQPADTQPNFLRAAVLQRDDRWGELALVARQWLKADASNAEPWYLLGLALENMSEPVAARHALGCSLRIETAHGPASRRLTALQGRHGTDPALPDSAVPCSHTAP